MAAENAPLTAHSYAEATLFLTATPCIACGRGPLRAKSPVDRSASESPRVVDVQAECVSCHGVSFWAFRMPQLVADAINPTSDASEILDVAQWIMLSGMIAASATAEIDKVRKRRLYLEAAQCLDEALKFYLDDSDLPPAAAFFHEGSRSRLRESPEHFSRQRLLHLRSRLPRSAGGG